MGARGYAAAMEQPSEGEAVPKGLPVLVGGWARRSVPVGHTEVVLWSPRNPEALLDDVEVVARNRADDSMPYWAWVWDSAPRLARLVAQHAGARTGRVLELGAGLGLAGLAAAAAGLHVVLTDHDPLALRTLEVQVDANRLAGRAEVRALDWRRPDDLEEGAYGWVLGCDVLYEANAHEPVLAVVERALAAGGAAWFADPGRTRLPGFLRRAAGRGFAVHLMDEHGREADVAAGEFRVVVLRQG